MASLRRATSNIAAQVVSLAAALIDRIVLVGLLLREWGADTFADYAIVQSWAALLLTVELGAQIYFQNEEQSAFVAGDKTRFRRIAGTHLGTDFHPVQCARGKLDGVGPDTAHRRAGHAAGAAAQFAAAAAGSARAGHFGRGQHRQSEICRPRGRRGGSDSAPGVRAPPPLCCRCTQSAGMKLRY